MPDYNFISIHAPLAGSDSSSMMTSISFMNFNPRSPCGERHGIPCHQHQHGSDFNPRSPCGERLFAPGNSRSQPYFNPRSPCGERHIVWNHTPGSLPFQSTLPLRGATLVPLGIITKSLISIHAPLAGSDRGVIRSLRPFYYFNPRSPCGERPGPHAVTYLHIGYFNPRSPCGERPLFR